MNTSGWLLKGGEAKTSVFHLGRYCSEWKASTYSYGEPSFHIVLGGECWLDLFNQQPRIMLEKGDILFFFNNFPFYLTSSPDKSIDDLPRKQMSKIEGSSSDATDLLCGFIQPNSIASQLRFALLPDIFLIRQKDDVSNKIHSLFELLLTEVNASADENNCIIAHLTDAILHYVVNESTSLYDIDINLLNAANDEPLAKLIIAIIENPQYSWSLDDMARFTYMSRSTFIRRILKATSYTPNLVLSKLRIYVSLNLLRRGIKTEDIYSSVGYESLSGFYQAFKRVMGTAPGDYLSSYK
ncbi:AraC family transcriptional regulator [Citrobacter arsenatis]|uniref:AraC family transcriptional regulator n=1 Tax=Citrobacter arsenatis TaxID=2546350 RepID=UPI00300E183B